MGLSDKELGDRMTDKHVQGIETTNKDSGKDFIFISYKSDDWKVVLHDIVYELHKNYGLRVYFDKEFDKNNEVWHTQLIMNMRHERCKGVLAFIDNKYATSYATLMELMCSKVEMKKRALKVITVNLENIKESEDEEDTGLGDSQNLNAGSEKEKFMHLCKRLQREGDLDPMYEPEYEPLTKKQCSRMVIELLGKFKVNENRYRSEGMDVGSFCRPLADTIRSAVGGSVFEEVRAVPVSKAAGSGSALSMVPLQEKPYSPSVKRKKAQRLNLSEMVEKGTVKIGDAVYVKGHPEALGTIAGDGNIQYQGEKVSLNQYVKRAFADDASRNAYIYVCHKATDKLLDELRDLGPQQESQDAGGMERETEETAGIAEPKETAADVPCTAKEPARDEIISPSPLVFHQGSPSEKKEEGGGVFRENTLYRYRFFGETASLKILSIKKGGKGAKVDAVLMAGSTVKELWEGGSVDYRMADGGKKRARDLYDRILPKTERLKAGYLKVKEDIRIEDESLSAIATMVSGASVAPAVAWRE